MSSEIRTLWVVRPETYKLLQKSHAFLNRDPFGKYVQQLRYYLDEILKSNELSAEAKKERYVKLMGKLKSLASSSHRKQLNDLGIEETINEETINEAPINEGTQDVVDEEEILMTPKRQVQGKIAQLALQFSPDTQSRIGYLVDEIQNTPGVKISPQTLSVQIDGKPINENLSVLIHSMVSVNGGEISEGMGKFLKKMAMDSSLSWLSIRNKTLREYFKQHQKGQQEPQEPQEWLIPPELLQLRRSKRTKKKKPPCDNCE